jgi:hypothetical protein
LGDRAGKVVYSSGKGSKRAGNLDSKKEEIILFLLTFVNLLKKGEQIAFTTAIKK